MDKLSNLSERIKKNFKENKVLLFVVTIIWMLIIVFSINRFKDTLGKEAIGNDFHDKYVELDKNTSIEATIPVEDDTESISIMFATYARRNKGEVNVVITGNTTNKEYVNKSLNVKSIQDNSYATFGLNEKLDKKDNKLNIKLTSNSEKGKSVAVYYSSDKYFEDSKLSINNKTNDGDLTVKYLIHNDKLQKVSNLILTFSIIGLTLVILVLLLVNPKYENVFLLMIIVFGLITNIMITPMSGPDEQLHYENCLQLSNYVFGKGETHTNVEYEYARDSHFAGHYNTGMAYVRLADEFNKPYEQKDKYKECSIDVADQSYFLYYVPQVFGIVLGRLLKLNMLKLYYLGRTTNLLFYALCIYLAIKNTPKHKLLFGILATMPTLMQQATSYSYDSFVYGLSFLELSYILKWINLQERIKTKDFIIAFLTSLALAPAKVIYGCFSLLFFFVPKDRFGGKKQKVFMTLLLCSPAIFLILKNIWDRLSYLLIIYGATLSEEESYIFEVKLWNVPYIEDHFVETIQIILRTIRYQIKPWFYDSIGHILSGHTLVLPLYITYAHIVLILISSFVKEDTNYSPLFRIASICVCIGVGLLTLIGMLTGWTARGAELINGVQGRYFCPILPYFFITLSNKKIQLPTKLNKYVICSQVIMYFLVLMNVLNYTFVN